MDNQTIVIVAFVIAAVILCALVVSRKMKVKVTKEGIEMETDEPADPKSTNNLTVTNLKNKADVKVKKPKDTNVKIDDVDNSKLDIS